MNSTSRHAAFIGLSMLFTTSNVFSNTATVAELCPASLQFSQIKGTSDGSQPGRAAVKIGSSHCYLVGFQPYSQDFLNTVKQFTLGANKSSIVEDRRASPNGKPRNKPDYDKRIYKGVEAICKYYPELKNPQPSAYGERWDKASARNPADIVHCYK